METYPVAIKFQIMCQSDELIDTRIEQIVDMSYDGLYHVEDNEAKGWHPYPDGAILDWLQNKLGTKG